MTYCDFVLTPGIGLLISIGEDAARLHIIDRVTQAPVLGQHAGGTVESDAGGRQRGGWEPPVEGPRVE
jgi:hypothetical protein